MSGRWHAAQSEKHCARFCFPPICDQVGLMCTNFLKLPHWVNAHHSLLCQAYKDSPKTARCAGQSSRVWKSAPCAQNNTVRSPVGWVLQSVPVAGNYLVGYIFRILCALSWSFSEVMQHMVTGWKWGKKSNVLTASPLLTTNTVCRNTLEGI